MGDVQHLAQSPLAKLGVIRQHHHPAALPGQDLLDPEGGLEGLEGPFLGQQALGGEEGDVDARAP